MLNQILESQILTFILTLFISSFAGFLTFVVFYLNKLKFVINYNHFFTFIILPPVTAAITKIIAGNLALSLGMVGALSIVRFRNPVRSPLELAIYFFLIASGIVFNVNIQYGIIFVLSIFLIFFLGRLIVILSQNILKLNFLFDNQNYKILELSFLKPQQDLEINKNLIFFSKNLSEDNLEHYNYKIKIKNDDDLSKLLDKNPISYNFFNESE